MKKGIFIILILILVCGVIAILKGYNTKEFFKDMNNLSNEISKINNTENNVIEDNNINIDKNNSNIENKTDNSEDSTTLNVKKISEKQYNSYYEKVEDIAKNWITVNKQSDNLTVRLIETRENDTLLDGSKEVEYNKDYSVSMVNADKVKNIYYCIMGQDIDYPLIFLLQDDGTVKVIETREGYKTGKFVAKNIKELNNIKKIEQVSISPPNDSGYIGVVAIAEDGQIYEICQIQTN